MSARTPSGPTRDRRRRVAAGRRRRRRRHGADHDPGRPERRRARGGERRRAGGDGGGYLAPYFTEGDLTDDEAVSLDDLDLVGPALGTTDTDAGWSGLAPADLDADGELELRDSPTSPSGCSTTTGPSSWWRPPRSTCSGP